MFERLRLWIVGGSGMQEAARDAAREATREGLSDGFRLGVDDFLSGLSGREEPRTIEATATNGRQITAAELRNLRKAELLDLAADRGIDSDGLTAAELREQLAEKIS